ncbi:Bestrophin, RFP-TM, chloride channel-domain-containing protein [Armillaria luteobubalina]|uniref:Bestrophin, RFP-TM, chloride channel-domain-containing protein n=1 Tax=Armillaria luteobubalina TaxID=153913 RepID=A0AA39QHI6_9AGAR|nr:Bestrophin, RFP-TM, chloride channel-domain-containing protein [Armillaria luteobubalina]
MKPPKIRRRHLRKYSWLPDVLRIKGSIIPRVWGPVLTVTIFATFVAYAHTKGHHVQLTNSVVPLLSVVVGLILVFRNGTSYDRYWEGRKSFASMTSNIRNLSRLIWVNVAPPPSDQEISIKGKTKIITPKHTTFVEKTGTNWDDYRGLLPPSFLQAEDMGYRSDTYSATRSSSPSPSDSSSGAASIDRPNATKRVRVKRSKPHLVSQTTPLLSIQFVEETSLPLPLIISHELGRMIFHFRRDWTIRDRWPSRHECNDAIGMVDQMTTMERVANTPIPPSYGIHLKQCVTLYLFALPLTLVNDLGWTMIPIVTVVAFTLMGIEGIADEIEMPFGTDKSDLPLDTYCQDLKEEIGFMITRLPEVGEGVYGYDDGEGDD